MLLNKSFKKCKKRSEISDKHDKIYTPLKLSKDIINIIDLKQGDIVLEPFLGEGSFYNQYPNYVIKKWCEIDKGVDFLLWDERCDWIITNPPFSKLNIMIDKMISLANKGIAIIIMTQAMTSKRSSTFENNGFHLTHMEQFNCRPLFGFPMSLFIFEKNKSSIHYLDNVYEWL